MSNNYLSFDVGTALFGSSTTNWSTPLDVGRLIGIIVSNAVYIAGFLLLVIFLYGGFSIISGAGQSNPQKAAQGKQAATSAAIGFLIIFIAYWIIKLLEIIFHFTIL